MRFLRDLSTKDIAGKICLVRTNLDITNPRHDSLRIKKALPTITFLLQHGAKPIIISHRGRPKKKDSGLSLKPAIDILSQKIGRGLEWRENLRFDPRETGNNSAFAKKIAEGADMYVNDDFAASHHEAASLVAITRFLPSYAGLLLQDEINILSAIRDKPKKPLVVIIGGIKIKDKIHSIETLKNKTDWFLLGSAYGELRELLPSGANIILPTDWQKENGACLDIGPKTIRHYRAIITAAKTIIWNGPLGKVEKPAYAHGSEAIARAIIHSKAFSVAGGGDTTDFLANLGLLQQFNFASTGGGAMLAFLAHKPLPALKALDNCSLYLL